jgi:hypothetical protein
LDVVSGGAECLVAFVSDVRDIDLLFFEFFGEDLKEMGIV